MKRRWEFLHGFFVFFLIMAFVISCCMTLFLSVLGRELNMVYTEEMLAAAAKLTFGNVVLLAVICAVIDLLRRRWMVERPAKRIIEAAEKLMQGRFDVRIPTNFAVDSSFAEIIGYFNRMAEALSTMETLSTDFVSNVSHELKTPLSIIQNYATMLSQPGLPEEKRQDYACAIREASGRLTSLVSNILKLNKLENAQIFPETQVYDLSEQLCRCLLNDEELLERKQLQVETDLDEKVLVKADPEMMELVWYNLISNAIKFTEPGGRIALRVKAEGDDAVVQVQDSGCGISPEVGRRIFDKFYQGDPSRASQGDGLGLALVKRVMDISGSEISVTSEVGRGSTFTVRMRRVQHET